MKLPFYSSRFLNCHRVFMVWGFRMELFSRGFCDVLLLKNVKHLIIDVQLFLLFNLNKKDGYCENLSNFWIWVPTRDWTAETARNINAAFEEVSAKERAVRFWIKRFRGGNFDLKNEPWERPPDRWLTRN